MIVHVDDLCVAGVGEKYRQYLEEVKQEQAATASPRGRAKGDLQSPSQRPVEKNPITPGGEHAKYVHKFNSDTNPMSEAEVHAKALKEAELQEALQLQIMKHET